MTGIEEPSLVDTGKGITVRYKNRYLYSSLDPLGPIKRRIQNVPLLDKTLFFVPSIGLGYGLQELLERLPEKCHILCVEVDQALMGLAITQPYVSLPKSSRLSIVRTDDPAHLIQTLHTIGIEQFRRVQSIHLCRGYELYRDTYDRFERILEEEIQTYWKNKITLIHMGRLWIKNTLENFPLIARSGNLGNLTTNSSVIVAGAGPSLEESLPLIQHMRERVVLLATDTILPVLAAEKIKPDAVVALESQLANIQDFIGIPLEGVPLICDITCSPNVVRLFDDRIYFFSSSFYPLSLYERMSLAGLLPFQIPPLGSVGVAALHIALELTSAPVFVAGLDFSYVRNQTHARGTPIYRLMFRRASRVRPVGQISFESIASRPLLRLEVKDGAMLLSDLVLHGYAQQVARIYQKSPRFYKLSGGGFLTDVPVVETESELEPLLESEYSPGLRQRESDPGSAASTEQGFKIFVEQEKKRLARGLEVLKRMIEEFPEGKARSGQAVSIPPAHRSLLKELEYLYFYFPDPPPTESFTQDYLTRIYCSAQSLQPLWERLMLR